MDRVPQWPAGRRIVMVVIDNLQLSRAVFMFAPEPMGFQREKKAFLYFLTTPPIYQVTHSQPPNVSRRLQPDLLCLDITMTGHAEIDETSRLAIEGNGANYGKGIRDAFVAGDQQASRCNVCVLWRLFPPVFCTCFLPTVLLIYGKYMILFRALLCTPHRWRLSGPGPGKCTRALNLQVLSLDHNFFI